MYFYSTEHTIDYANYQFAYTRYAVLETPEELDLIYPLGYLPYSADLSESVHRFYMARSLRFDLAKLEFDKKRRYLQKQISPSAIQTRILSREPLLEHCDTDWQAQVSNWMQKRFDQPYLSAERLQYILQKPFANRLMSITWQGKPFAEILLCCGNQSVHYWFAFYNPELEACESAGKWLIGHFLQWAKAQHFHFAYIGTCYGSTSAYKFHGLTPTEFWDGSQWNQNKAILKKLLQQI